MLPDIPTASWWVIDAGAAATFWALMVPWVPKPKARRQMSAVPLAGVPTMLGVYWVKGYTASSILALYALILIALVIAVWPFRKPLAKMITEEESAGRDIRDRRLRDGPRGMAAWLIFVLTAVVVVSVIILQGETPRDPFTW